MPIRFGVSDRKDNNHGSLADQIPSKIWEGRPCSLLADVGNVANAAVNQFLVIDRAIMDETRSTNRGEREVIDELP